MRIALTVLLCATATTLGAQTSAPPKSPPTPDELAAITTRGRLLAQYDRAA